MSEPRFGATALPAEQQQALRKAKRLQVISLVYLASAVTVVALVMGSSQAMKAAWIEDCLSFLPPVAFLVAAHVTRRPPDEEHPYGYHRAIGAAHLAAAVALLGLGGFLLVESALTLVRREHPTIGTLHLFGRTVWAGWPMIAALVYTGFPNVVLGRMKLKLSEQLHDKVLFADADMNKADWLTAAGAIAGVLGIGFGLWWADASVASLIAASIVKDGWKNLGNAVTGLLDRQARTHDDESDHPLLYQVDRLFRELPWAEEVLVRMRDQGHVFHTEVLVKPRAHSMVDVVMLDQARAQASALDWKLDDLQVVLVRELPSPEAE